MPDSAPQERGVTGGDGGLQPHSLGGPNLILWCGCFRVSSSVPPPIVFFYLTFYVIVRLANVVVLSPVAFFSLCYFGRRLLLLLLTFFSFVSLSFRFLLLVYLLCLRRLPFLPLLFIFVSSSLSFFASCVSSSSFLVSCSPFFSPSCCFFLLSAPFLPLFLLLPCLASFFSFSFFVFFFSCSFLAFPPGSSFPLSLLCCQSLSFPSVSRSPLSSAPFPSSSSSFFLFLIPLILGFFSLHLSSWLPFPFV